MKSILKSLTASLLALLARAVVRKYRPKIVMITGSVGKTSTKDAVAAALGSAFHVRASEKSYNSEFGVPLTILGAKNPWMDAHKWIRVIEEGIALLLLPSHYPKLLVLEVGADRPGDLARILKIVTPDAVVVTALPEVPVHVEAYASPEAVREEEFAPAYALPGDAPLIICADDVHAKAMASRLPAKISTFGFSEGADVRITAPIIAEEQGRPSGMRAQVITPSGEYTLSVLEALGRPQLLAPSAALALSRALGLTDEEALAGLRSYVPPPGRCRILEGIQDSLILDDSYNASPLAVEEALAILSEIPCSGRRIAVIGDMLELGRYSVQEHERVGKAAAGKADIVLGVGVRARALTNAARANGMDDEHARGYESSSLAAQDLKTIVQKGDVVLIKGSQGVRMERVVEALLLNPEDKKKLVRQEKEWKKR
jgi:UDP-N-acetylmuramoyl-tripeptide--D-alanyl-D-alanine ligase